MTDVDIMGAMTPLDHSLLVMTTSVARKSLPSILDDFRREGAEAEPVVFGSYRKPEGVMLSYESFERMVSLLEDMEIAALVSERESGASEVVEGVDDLAEKSGIDPDEIKPG